MIAFKSTPTISDDDKEEEEDEDLSLLVRNVRRMYNKKRSTIKRRWQDKEEKNHLFQLLETRTYHCRMSENKKQVIFLKQVFYIKEAI